MMEVENTVKGENRNGLTHKFNFNETTFMYS